MYKRQVQTCGFYIENTDVKVAEVKFEGIAAVYGFVVLLCQMFHGEIVSYIFVKQKRPLWSLLLKGVLGLEINEVIRGITTD